MWVDGKDRDAGGFSPKVSRTKGRAHLLSSPAGSVSRGLSERGVSLGIELAEETGELFQGMPPDLFLRSADALHLACARHHGYRVIYSNDRNLLAAAKYFGLQGRNVIATSF